MIGPRHSRIFDVRPVDILQGKAYSSSSISTGDALSPEQTNLLQGTLDMVILKALRLGEMHGLGISRRIEQISQGTFVVKSGSLFPALRRMQEEGWISSAWGESETNRRAKYYRLTKAGVKQLEEETAKWERIVVGISRTLEAS